MHIKRFSILLIGVFFFSNTALFYSTSSAAAESGEASQNNSEKAEIDPMQLSLDSIEAQKGALQDLDKRIAKSEGLSKTAYELRYDKTLIKLLELNLAFAEDVARLDKEEIREQHRQKAVQILNSQFALAPRAVKLFQKQIVLPEDGKSAAELAAAYSRLYSLVASMNHSYELWFKTIGLSREFEIDVGEQETLLKDIFIERAANISVMLEYAMDNVTALRASVAVVPTDAELTARLSVATEHVQRIAGAFDFVLVMMDDMKLDTSDYREQLLNATGQITTDTFEVGVITNLLVGWGDRLWTMIVDDGPNLIINLFLLVIIFLAFRKLADVIQPLVERALDKSHLELSELLRRMVISVARNIIIILGILIALSQVGISLGPLLAGLGVVGLVIGFALQDTLSNFAAGMMILIYRPFDVGDYVEAGTVTGTVDHMSLVNTTIMTIDNQKIIVPNNKVWGDVIRNVTSQTTRRVDMVFGISYSDDIPKTERILQEILDAHEKVLDEPESMIRLHELGDSSVNFVVRPWTARDDYWDVYWDITRSVKMRFDEEGISFPFPQRDVHLYNESSA